MVRDQMGRSPTCLHGCVGGNARAQRCSNTWPTHVWGEYSCLFPPCSSADTKRGADLHKVECLPTPTPARRPVCSSLTTGLILLSKPASQVPFSQITRSRSLRGHVIGGDLCDTLPWVHNFHERRSLCSFLRRIKRKRM